MTMLLSVLGLMLALTARLFVWPATDALVPADAIVVLDGSPRKARRAKGISLARLGYAPVLVVSVPRDSPCTEEIPRVKRHLLQSRSGHHPG